MPLLAPITNHRWKAPRVPDDATNSMSPRQRYGIRRRQEAYHSSVATGRICCILILNAFYVGMYRTVDSLLRQTESLKKKDGIINGLHYWLDIPLRTKLVAFPLIKEPATDRQPSERCNP